MVNLRKKIRHVLREDEELIVSAIDSWRMREHDRMLAETIGGRFLGTEGDRRSINYVADYFKNWGLQVEMDPVETLSFDYRGATLSVSERISRNIDLSIRNQIRCDKSQ